MNLDMMFANFQDGNAKADAKQDSVNKADDKQDAKQDLDNKKQDFANKMMAIQESVTETAWKSFKEKIEGLPAGTPVAEATEKAFKKCCDAAIASMLLAAALMS